MVHSRVQHTPDQEREEAIDDGHCVHWEYTDEDGSVNW
jgi:hypothetical protein